MADNSFIIVPVNLEVIPAAAYELELTVNPENAGEVSGAGSYAAGTQVSVSAIANEGFIFVNWTDNQGNVVSDEASFQYTMSFAHVSLVANFEVLPMFTLSLEISPADAGTVSGEGSYYENETITISAVANENFIFLHWMDTEENIISTQSEIEITMPGNDYTLIAKFQSTINVNEWKASAAKVYPNPTSGKINIDVATGIQHIRIANTAGQVVFDLLFNGEISTVLHLEGLENGIYILNALGKDGNISRSLFVIKK